MALHLPRSPLLSLSCPKHTRFNGSDVGAVKGGCTHCLDLVSIREHWLRLHAAIARFKEMKAH